MPRAGVRKLVAELLDALPVDDPAMYLWGVADLVEGEMRQVGPWADALAETVRARVARDADWRSKTDLTLRGMIWLATTAVALRQEGLLDALLEMKPENAAEENAYLRATLWGYIDIADLGVVPMLRDRALRLWVARAMPELATKETADQAFAHPLATIDVLMRAHGLSHYVDAATD
jgi:lysine-N-methylase